MSDAFHLQIISPSAILVDAHVPMVEIPGVEGDFGVLPGHSNVFSMLRPGAIDVKMADGHHRRFFAATGYADVTPVSCTIISDHIQDMSEIGTAEVEEALAAAREAVAQAETPAEREQAEKLHEAAEALAMAVNSRNH